MSLSAEVPAVHVAVSHLQELATRMKSDDFNFKDSDVSNIDKVIEAIYELNQERINAHEHLETESIKASVLRYKLLAYPAAINNEIEVAVLSARQSNTDALANLQKQLETINEHIQYLDNRQKDLEKENSVLHPEREQIRQQHEEIISQLNQRMAEKASMQITLNETRDSVRQANQNILDLEDGIIQLKEDLIQERQDARIEKKSLKDQVAETTREKGEQDFNNVREKRQLDQQNDELNLNNATLEGMQRNIRRLDASRNSLLEKEMQLTIKLQNIQQENEDLKQKGNSIDQQMKREEEEFQMSTKNLKDNIQWHDTEIVGETHKSYILDGKRVELLTALQKKMVIRKSDKERVSELDISLQNSKATLASKAEEVGRLQVENGEVEEQLDNLEESHKSVVTQLNSQIEEHREQLSMERGERLELQKKRDVVQQNLDEYRCDNQTFMTEMNTVITQKRTEHKQLAEEGATLQQDIKVDEEIIEKLSTTLTTVEESFNTMNSGLTQEIVELEHDITELVEGHERKDIQYKDEAPKFEQFQKDFEENIAIYDRMKKEVVVMKNKKMGMVDSIKHIKRDKDKLLSPLDKLKDELKHQREESLNILRLQAGESKDVETEIYSLGCKLKTLIEENSHFIEANSGLEASIANLHNQMKDNEIIKEKLYDRQETLKSELVHAWKNDSHLQNVYAKRDQSVVDGLEELLKATQHRGTKISDITGQLDTELGFLAQFLHKVSQRRPPDTREGRRAQTAASKKDAIEAVAQVNAEASLLPSQSFLLPVLPPITKPSEDDEQQD